MWEINVLFLIVWAGIISAALLIGLGVAKLVRWAKDRYWWVRWVSL